MLLWGAISAMVAFNDVHSIMASRRAAIPAAMNKVRLEGCARDGPAIACKTGQKILCFAGVGRGALALWRDLQGCGG